MKTTDLLTLYDLHQRIRLEHPGVLKEIFQEPDQALPRLVRFTRPAPGMNFISYSHLRPAEADAVIREQVIHFSEFDQPYEWLVYEHDQPGDLRDRLIEHGFQPDDDPSAVMVLAIHDLPPALLRPAPPQVEIRRLEKREQLEDVITVMEGVYNSPFGWMRSRMGDHMEIPGFLSIYVAYVGQQPACAGWTYFYPGSAFGSLYGGSTLEAYRRQGLYLAILSARAQEARTRGCQYLTVDAGPMSRPIVAAHGFKQITTSWSYSGVSKKE